MKKSKLGFSLLEMIIAVFIIALVIGFSLFLMGTGLQITKKSNEMILSASIAQYEIDYAKNIPFPPTTFDRQADFSADPRDGTNPATDSWFINESYSKDLELWVGHRYFYSTGLLIPDDGFGQPTGGYDMVALIELTVRVRRKRDDTLLLKTSTYIARNGQI